MAMKPDRKDHPISMRLPEPDIAMIDRAAGLRGRSRTDFVREAAVRAAEDVLMENRMIRMTADGLAEFIAILSAPAAAVPEMVALAKRPAPWEPGYIAKSQALSLSGPEPLFPAHGVSAFSCGKPSLDHWLKTRARSNQEKGFTAVLVVNAIDLEAAAFWRRRGFLPSRDDPLIHVRSIADIAASLA